jgi:hypothetical protein
MRALAGSAGRLKTTHRCLFTCVCHLPLDYPRRVPAFPGETIHLSRSRSQPSDRAALACGDQGSRRDRRSAPTLELDMP